MTTPKLFWGSTRKALFPKQPGDIEANFLVIGGGISGLAAAYFLLKAGKRNITIIERDTIGSGSTGHSAGMLVTQPEQGNWYKLVQTHGLALTKKYYDEHVEAAKLVKKVIKDGNIECQLATHDYLSLKKSDPEHSTRIWKEYCTVKRALGDDVEALSGTALQHELPSTLFRFAERNRKYNLAVNPLLFAQGFASYLASRGVTVLERTTFEKQLDDVTIKTDRGIIIAKHTIFCRGKADNSKQLEHFLTTIAVTKPLTQKQLSTIGLDDKDMFSESDGKETFFYGRITNDNRLLLGYGDKLVKADTATTLHAPHLKQIERFLKQQFPTLTTTVTHAWSAPYALAKGSVPHVSVKDNVATIGGAGIQLGSIVTSSYAVATLLKKPHPLKRFFS